MSPDDERWLLSYYAHSEAQGARFFGRLARVVRGPLAADLALHHADEERHATWWNELLRARQLSPASIEHAYQDRYLEAAGLPANLMEVLAITHVFEKRAAGQYAEHRARAGTAPDLRDTLDRILRDEGRHIAWVAAALRDLEPEYGADTVRATLERFEAADREVHAATLSELGQRLPAIPHRRSC